MMRWEEQKSDPGKSPPIPRLVFQFASEERKHLARLKQGQRVTIEGVLGEPTVGEAGFILFKDCKVIDSAKE
jgi:hypothetical protein